MKKKRSIVLIGSGNVATVLGTCLKKHGYSILQVYSRKQARAGKLAKKLSASAISDLSRLDPGADIYLVAVKDDVILKLGKKLRLDNKLVLHTSGSVSLEAIGSCSVNTGVLYPVQSFSETGEPDLSSVPFCIEGSNRKALATIKEIACALSDNVCVMSSLSRSKLHLAAVFANNFGNHMFAIAELLLSRWGIDPELLDPLLLETAQKAIRKGASNAQTGPASRNDQNIIRKQLSLLKKDKELQKIYKLITESIRRR